MKSFTLNILIFLIMVMLLLVTIFIYFLNLSLLVVVTIVAVLSLLVYFFIYKNTKLQEKIPLGDSAFSNVAKKFLYPRLIILAMLMPMLASEMGEVFFVYILGIILAVTALILLLYEIQKGPNVKKLFFWILFALLVLFMNIRLFQISLKNN